MSLYAIKDEDGELRDTAWDSPNITREFYAYTDVSVDDATREAAKHRDSHVVELVEKSEPVEVGKYNGQLLTSLKEEVDHGLTTHSANYYVTKLKCQHDMSTEDIFRALDVGWTVKQPKRWYVKTPKEWGGDGRDRLLFWKDHNNGLHTQSESNHHPSPDEQFTAEEIDKYHLGGFEKVEVEDHE